MGPNDSSSSPCRPRRFFALDCIPSVILAKPLRHPISPFIASHSSLGFFLPYGSSIILLTFSALFPQLTTQLRTAVSHRWHFISSPFGPLDFLCPLRFPPQPFSSPLVKFVPVRLIAAFQAIARFLFQSPWAFYGFLPRRDSQPVALFLCSDSSISSPFILLALA